MSEHTSKRLRDADIRLALKLQVVPELLGECDGRAVEEVCLLAGEVRVDLAVLNGRLHAFEIKSEADTLERLALQMNAYNRVFDTVTLVCGKKHLVSVSDIVPSWWGLAVAVVEKNEVLVKTLRPALSNPSVDPLALVQLLWKEELLQLLRSAGVYRGIKSNNKQRLWEKSVKACTVETIRNFVREALKSRRNWRSDEQQK